MSDYRLLRETCIEVSRTRRTPEVRSQRHDMADEPFEELLLFIVMLSVVFAMIADCKIWTELTKPPRRIPDLKE